jgi:hypothetical protein
MKFCNRVNEVADFSFFYFKLRSNPREETRQRNLKGVENKEFVKINIFDDMKSQITSSIKR